MRLLLRSQNLSRRFPFGLAPGGSLSKPCAFFNPGVEKRSTGLRQAQREREGVSDHRRGALALIAVLLASSLPGVATAQSTSDRSDARCIMVLGLASSNPAQKDAAVRGQFYYYGRISARSAGAKLGAMMVSEARAINSPRLLQAELARCGAELTAANAGLNTALRAVDAAARQVVKPGAVPPK